jgi:hypothetical protein
MAPFLRTRHFGLGHLGLAVSLSLISGVLWAADASNSNATSNAKTVEMFAAMASGDIAVKIIPKDSSLCHVLIENKTDKPISVKLPNTFAAVPVLAQIGSRGTTNRSGSSGGSSNRNGSSGGGQSMGGGMGMSGGGMSGGGMGFNNIPAEKVGKFDVTTVCLEHGKAEPRAQMAYEIKPIEEFTTKPGVRELCESLGTGDVNQRAAQAAAWYLNNGMTWEQLAAKRIRHANGTSEPYFSQEELQAATRLAHIAIQTAHEREKQEPSEKKEFVSPGEALNPVESTN